MSGQSFIDSIRQWLAGKVFRFAGFIHESYDVWLDDAPRRDTAPVLLDVPANKDTDE